MSHFDSKNSFSASPLSDQALAKTDLNRAHSMNIAQGPVLRALAALYSQATPVSLLTLFEQIAVGGWSFD